jgi:Family of unknown function (DUF6298)
VTEQTTTNSVEYCRLKYKAVSLLIILGLLAISAVVAVLVYEETSNAEVDYTTTAVVRSGITRPLVVHSSNPRYFSDGSGRAIYLTGSHTWNNIQDIRANGRDGTKPFTGGFSGHLDWLQSYNHNFIRFWILEHAWDAEHGDAIAPHPWLRTGPGTALDGNPKFDLTKLDEAYFSRLRERAAAAGDRGFYVSIMLFDGWSTDHAGPWKGHPFNVRNNVNGIDGDPDGDGLGREFHTLRLPAITELQETYAKKVVDTVNDLDNILYEIANETGVSKAWQYRMVDTIKQYEMGKAKRHPVGTTVGSNVSASEVDDAALFAGRADWISPSASGGYRDNPPAADGSKVIIADTDHLWGLGGDRTWVWKSFLRGLNPIYMDDLGEDSERATKEEARMAMGDTLRYATRMNLAAMVPRQDLASTTYCLADPGVEYLVYLPIDPWTASWMGSTRVFWRVESLVSELLRWSVRLRSLFRQVTTVDLTSASKELSVEWFNPSTHTAVTSGKVAGGSRQRFQAAFRGDAVLYLSASRAEP